MKTECNRYDITLDEGFVIRHRDLGGIAINMDDLVYIHSAESQSRPSVLVTLFPFQGISKFFS
jgi:hypothetical protein